MEEVNEYKYLGHEIRISRDNQTQELARRIELGWAAYGRLKDVFNSGIPISLKSCVLPVFRYGAETLTLTKNVVSKLRVALRKMERAMLAIRLQDRIRNTEISRRTQSPHLSVNAARFRDDR